MSVTSAMDVIDYEVWNFNYDPHLFRHPLWMTSNHLKYRLFRDNLGVMHCLKDGEGRYIKSPRSLSDVCIYDIVCNLDILRQMQDPYLPLDLYPRLLSEAIYQRELHAIEYLIATWPQSVLKLYDVVPLEDQIEHDYLTTPIDGNEGTNLLDCIMLGLLNRQPQAMMQVIDFTGFEKDRKLCRELSRLPVLWMEPEDRTVNMLYDYMYPTYEIAKDKIQRYLNRISVIYHQFDSEFKHGTKMAPLTILLDLKMTLDDVAFGLCLQWHTPFRFVCNKLWIKEIPEVGTSTKRLANVLELSLVTHLEISSPCIAKDGRKLREFLAGIEQLKHVTALSIPSTVDTSVVPQAAEKINKTLQKMRTLKRLNFAYCNLKLNVKPLLQGLSQKFEYLNLRDCRLIEDDVHFLLHWKPVVYLRELNLSNNNLTFVEHVSTMLVQKMKLLACFAVSYCSLSVGALQRIVKKARLHGQMKVLAIQNFTPMSDEDMSNILLDCAMVTTLQKCIMLPETYAFPGNNENEREENLELTLDFCYEFLRSHKREDIAIA